MGIVFRQSAKNSIIVALGALLGILVLWLSTKYIPKREFGFTNGLVFWAITICQLLIVGTNSTLSFYIHKYADNERKRKLLITLCLFIPLVLAVLFSVVYCLLRTTIVHHYQPEDRSLMDQYFMWFPIFAVGFIYMTQLEIYLGSQMKVAIASFMREIVLRILNIGLILLFAYQWINFDQLVAGMVVIYLVPIALFFVFSFRTKIFGFSFRLRNFTLAEYKELLHFSWYHFLLSITLILLAYMDMLLLPIYDHDGYAAVAIYRIAIFLIVLLQLPSKAFLPASYTVLAKAFADNDLVKARDIFVRSSTNLLIPTVGIGVILLCNLNNVTAVIQNGYSAIVPVFYILAVGSIVNLATGMNDQVLSVANYYKFNFYLSLTLIILLFLLIKFLVPHYGIYGAAFSTTATLIIFNIAKFLFVWKKLDMQPFSKQTLLIVFAALPALAVGYFFPYFFNPARHIYVHSIIDAVVRSAAIAIVYIAMLLWLQPSPDLTEYISSIRKNKRLF